jgi:cell division protein FtsA
VSREYIAALDIGTTKVSVIVGRMVGGSLEVAGYGVSPSAGVRKGVIVDLEAAGVAVYEAISMAEDNSGIEIRSVYAGVAGSHLECVDSYGATGIRGKTVGKRDMDRVMESASTVYVPIEREVLHVLPREFAIDGQEGILKPQGMSGVRLEASVRIITAANSALDNIVRCTEQSDVRIVDMVFEALASAKSVLGAREMEGGTAVVDIGGGTTDVAVFRDGGLAHAAVIPVGGHQFTNDLAVGLRVTRDEAERIKTQYGHVAGPLPSPQEVEATFMDGSPVRFRSESIRNILEPRSTELLDMVASEIRPYLFDTSGSSVVLTGGASRLRGLERVAGASIGISARVEGHAGVLAGMDEELAGNPALATGMGLLLYGYEKETAEGAYVLGAFSRKIKGFARFFSSKRGRGYGSRKHVLEEPGA